MIRRYLFFFVAWNFISIFCTAIYILLRPIAPDLSSPGNWYWIYLVPLLVFGFSSGLLQSLLLRGTPLPGRYWFPIVLFGSILGSLLHISLQAQSVSDIFHSSVVTPLLHLPGLTNNPNKFEIIFSFFWDSLPMLVFLMSISISQWILLRNINRFSWLWVCAALLTEIILLLPVNFLIGLLCRFILPGIIITIFLYYADNKNSSSPKGSASEYHTESQISDIGAAVKGKNIPTQCTQ